MNEIDLRSLLDRLTNKKIGVLGDYCLDAYQFMDASASEISIETGLPTRPVRSFRFSLGGAGNVASNLASLGVGQVFALGVSGEDPYGWEMRKLLEEAGIHTQYLLNQGRDWSTHVYTKMYDGDRELERVDFGNFNILAEAAFGGLLSAVETLMPSLDALIINQQLINGIHTPNFRKALSNLLNNYETSILITDSRHYNDDFAGSMRKLNDREAAAICYPGRDDVGFEDKETAAQMAQQLWKRWGRPVFLTRGDRGCMVCAEGSVRTIPGLYITSRIDIVGAGDSMLAGIAAALAAGQDPASAASFGNFVAGVTIQKLFRTGTASPDEIIAIGEDPDYRYNPEKAESPRTAEYADNLDIEIVDSLPEILTAVMTSAHKYAIFDHDGTISTLRQGWEDVMEQVMMEIILGTRYLTAGEKTCNKVRQTVREFIDKTTGIQTLVQMRSLAELVREFGYVDRILDAHGYKAIYNERLMETVETRIRKFQSGERDLSDFTVKNAVVFLETLRERGVTLYLASGTDQADVIREAELLGYANLFNGGIYGALGKLDHEPKKVVIRQILKAVGFSGSPGGVGTGIVTFGDGPVELRETRKRGGIAVGIASDEVRRYGLNKGKRERLILAGAHFVIPDFSQGPALLKILYGA